MTAPKISLIITTIGSMNKALRDLGALCGEHDIDFLIVGDTKTDPVIAEQFLRHQDLHQFSGAYFPSDRHEDLRLTISSVLPFNHYSRKNIGYLLAKKNGADIIIETDDDNYPQNNYTFQFTRAVNGNVVNHNGWVNVYRYFTPEHIWPRGFPLDHVVAEHPVLGALQSVSSPIQQYLVNKNPDVDAVYRLVINKELDFNALDHKVVLDPFSWCPFNSQNTVWFSEVFPLLYLPSTCSSRMTDIFRSYIAQRILWTMDAHVSFGNATVYQDRNKHNLVQDFQEEVSGYLHDKKIIRILAEAGLRNGVQHMEENLFLCYKSLVDHAIFRREELTILDAWIHDIH